MPGSWIQDGTTWTKDAGADRAAVVSSAGLAALNVLKLQLQDPAHNVKALVRCSDDGRTGYEIGVEGADVVIREALYGVNPPATTPTTCDTTSGSNVLASVASTAGLMVGGTVKVTAGLAGPNDLYATIVRVSGSDVTIDAPCTNTAAGTGLEQLGLVRTASGDIPSAALATAAHGLTAGQPYTMEIRLVGNTIELRLNDAEQPALRYALVKFGDYTLCGFVSSVAGAVVLGASIGALTERRTGRADVLVAVVGGNVYASTGPDALALVQAGVFGSTSPVGMTEFNGRMVMVCDGRAVKYDPLTQSIVPWTDKSHPIAKVPGAENPGTTGLRFLITHRARIVGAGLAADAQNIYHSAVNDDDDHNTASDLPGAAFTTSGVRAARVGQPVVGLSIASNAAYIAGCVSSIYQVTGDPALGMIETTPVALDRGISGPSSMWLTEEGIVLAHGPAGVVKVIQGGRAVSLTDDVLTEGITIPQAAVATYSVTVIRDPQRVGVWFFLTPPEGDGLHFWYDERVGNFKPRAGGFRPATFPTLMQPRCACVWLGTLLVLGDDGYVRRFSNTAPGDDGEPIESFTTLPLLDPAGVQGDGELERMDVLLGRDSGPVTVDVYTGPSAERVYSPAHRRRVIRRTISAERTPIIQGARAPAMTAVIGSSALGNPWVIEAIDATLSSAGRSRPLA